MSLITGYPANVLHYGDKDVQRFPNHIGDGVMRFNAFTETKGVDAIFDLVGEPLKDVEVAVHTIPSEKGGDTIEWMTINVSTCVGGQRRTSTMYLPNSVARELFGALGNALKGIVDAES